MYCIGSKLAFLNVGAPRSYHFTVAFINRSTVCTFYKVGFGTGFGIPWHEGNTSDTLIIFVVMIFTFCIYQAFYLQKIELMRKIISELDLPD